MEPQVQGHRWLVLALLALLVCGPQPAHSHGTLLSPRSRSFVAYLTDSFYGSHGLNAGGNKAMGGYGALTWPASKLQTLCGDAPGEDRWDVPGPVQATYAAGQVVAIDVVMAVNHLGRFEFQLCDLDAKPADASSRCIKLSRADGKGTQWYLPYMAGWTGGNNGVDPPAYSDGSFSWYHMPEVLAEQGCSGQRFCNQYKDQVVYRTSWQLPANYTCSHCKLQWVWMTASSCWPPCAPEHASEPTCRNAQVFPECGQPGTTYPEHFFGCADVRVAAARDAALDSRTTGVAAGGATPLWEPGVALHSGRFGTPAAYQMFSTVPLTRQGAAAAAAAAAAVSPASAPNAGAAPVVSVAAAPAAAKRRAAVAAVALHAQHAPAAASDTRAATAQLPAGGLTVARHHTGRGAAASIQRSVRPAAAAAAAKAPPKVAV